MTNVSDKQAGNKVTRAPAFVPYIYAACSTSSIGKKATLVLVGISSAIVISTGGRPGPDEDRACAETSQFSHAFFRAFNNFSGSPFLVHDTVLYFVAYIPRNVSHLARIKNFTPVPIRVISPRRFLTHLCREPW